MAKHISTLINVILSSLRLLGVTLPRIHWGILKAVKAAQGFKEMEGYDYALRWLQHFLEGTGETLQIPEHLVLEALEGFRGKHSMLRHATAWEKSQHKGLRGVLEVYGSTRYEGGGFTGRPQLFYLIGGFKALWYEDNTLVIEDLYDWGKSPEGEFYCSEIPLDMPYSIHKALNSVLGDRYYPLAGFPLGEPGLSNALFFDLQQEGLSKPFLSTYKGKVDLQDFDFELPELEEEEPEEVEEEEDWLNRVIRFNHPRFTDEDLYGW